MRFETLGGLRCAVGGGDGAKTVVLMHGFGAPGGDLVPLARALRAPEGTRFVFPAAPLELPWGYDSRAWWLIDLEKIERALQSGRARDMADEIPPGLAPARESIVALLRDLETRHGVRPADVVLGGFSQGSMLALDVALRLDDPIAGLVLWSTTPLCGSEWEPLVAARSGMRAFMSHGTQDPLLPFSAAESLKSALQDAGWRVTWTPFRGGHEIPPEALDGAGELIRG